MYKLDLENAKEPEIKLPTSIGSYKKQENSRKTSTSASLTMLKSLYGSQQTGKFLKRWEYQTTLTLLRNLYEGQEETESDMEQWTGSKLRKEYVKAVYSHLVYLTYSQSTSCKMAG